MRSNRSVKELGRSEGKYSDLLDNIYSEDKSEKPDALDFAVGFGSIENILSYENRCD